MKVGMYRTPGGKVNCGISRAVRQLTAITEHRQVLVLKDKVGEEGTLWFQLYYVKSTFMLLN